MGTVSSSVSNNSAFLSFLSHTKIAKKIPRKKLIFLEINSTEILMQRKKVKLMQFSVKGQVKSKRVPYSGTVNCVSKFIWF